MIIKPKYIYLVILSNENRMQIAGCFYSKAKATRHAGFAANTFVQKLEIV